MPNPMFTLNRLNTRVTASNNHFERWKQSSLRPLIDLLNGPPAGITRAAILQAINQIPQAKRTKYRAALDYIRMFHPELRGDESLQAMEIARGIAVRYSTLIVTNAADYGGEYESPNADQVARLDSKADAPSVAAARRSGVPANLIQSSNKAQLFIGQEMTRERYAPYANIPGKIRFGRCFQCAALVAYELMKHEGFRALGLPVEICKTAGVKHYFVVVGRRNITANNLSQGINAVEAWGNDAFIIDIWQANLNTPRPLVGRETDAQFGEPAVTPPYLWPYINDADGDHLQVQNVFTPPFDGINELLPRELDE